jgi:hypothetical protein
VYAGATVPPIGHARLPEESARRMPATEPPFDVEAREMQRVLHQQHAMSDRFITYLLERNIRQRLLSLAAATASAITARTFSMVYGFGRVATKPCSSGLAMTASPE